MKVGIAGLGLIGGSLAKAYNRSGAVVYGYERFDKSIMIATIIALIATIQLIQFFGDRLVNKLRHTQGIAS